VGYDNAHIYLHYFGYGPVKLKELQDKGIV